MTPEQETELLLNIACGLDVFTSLAAVKEEPDIETDIVEKQPLTQRIKG